MPIINNRYKCINRFSVDNGLIIGRKQKTICEGEIYKIIDINDKEIRLGNYEGELTMSLRFFLEHFQQN